VTFESGVALLREFGFPVFVSMWFMWRLEKRMDRLFELMTSLMQATALLAKSVDDHLVHPHRANLTGPHPVLQEGKTP
jgi:hypothetical protein